MTTAPTSTRTTRGGDKREAILDAALQLFVRRGFHGTNVPSVAKQAGVAAGTIYRYFASKERLVNALYRRSKVQIRDHVLGGFSPTAPTREQFRGFWTRMASFVAEQPDAFAFLELHHHASYLDDASRELEGQLLELALMFLRPAQQRQEVKQIEPMLLMSLVMGAFIGMVRATWEHKLDLTPDNIAAAEQCCWEAIRI